MAAAQAVAKRPSASSSQPSCSRANGTSRYSQPRMPDQSRPISRHTRRTAGLSRSGGAEPCARGAVWWCAAGAPAPSRPQKKASGSSGLACHSQPRQVGFGARAPGGSVSRSSSAAAAAVARSAGAVARMAARGPSAPLSAPSVNGPASPETITALSTPAKAPVREPSAAAYTSAHMAQLSARKIQSEPTSPAAVCAARRTGRLGLSAQPSASAHMPSTHTTKMGLRPTRSAAKVSAGSASNAGRFG